MPEGDSLHRAARRIQPLVGEEVRAEAPHPRGAAVASLVDGRRLLAARAVGKNLLLEFEGDVVVRSHLRMRGRWSVVPAGSKRAGRPWLVLRGRKQEAVLWNGPVLELDRGRTARLGPDILTDPIEPARLRHVDQRRALGEILLDQRVVAGIGNLWKAEALWHARVSPWRTVRRGARARPRRSGAADEVVARGRPARAGRLPPRRASLSALRESDPLARPGRRQSDGVLVSKLPAVRRARPADLAGVVLSSGGAARRE
jgi:endonuclease-8